MFKKINVEDFNENPFTLFKKDGALLTAGTIEKHNTMTIGWGAMGVLWRDYIMIAYVKPTRYTDKFMKESKYFTICWFEQTDINKEILNFCGTRSGRDVNKDEICNLSSFIIDNAVAYQQARLIVVCEKIYEDGFEENGFIDDRYSSIYKDLAYHQRYVGKIISMYYDVNDNK